MQNQFEQEMAWNDWITVELVRYINNTCSVYMYIHSIRWQHKQDPNIYNGGSFAYQLRDAVVQYFRKYTL